MMSILHLLWIVPVCVALGYAIAAMMWMASDKRTASGENQRPETPRPPAPPAQSESGESPIAREARKAAEVGTQGDYIDWSKIPNKFDFVAADEDGKVYGFHFAPHLHSWGLPKWSADGKAGDWCDAHEDIVNDAIIGPLPTWRESLRKRPS